MENGFKPPKPNGVYKRLGFGKKKGNGVVVDIVDDADEVEGTEDLLVGGSNLLRDDLLALVILVEPVFLLLTELTTGLVSAVVLVAVAPNAASIPAKDGKPRPARFANKEFVKLILLKLLRLPSPLNAPRLGKPPNGIKRGLFFGSKLPRERPDRRELFKLPSEGKFKPEAIDVAAKLA